MGALGYGRASLRGRRRPSIVVGMFAAAGSAALTVQRHLPTPRAQRPRFDGTPYGLVPTRGEATLGCRETFGIDAMRQFLIAQK